MMFEEFLNTNDFHEADRIVRELNARFFHPQLVKQVCKWKSKCNFLKGIILALQKDEGDRQKVLSLLSALSKEDLVSKDHVKEGFSLCFQILEDLKLDLPNAPSHLKEFVKSAKDIGILDGDFQEL